MKSLAIALLLTAAPLCAHDGVVHEPGLAPQTTAQIHAVAAAVARYRDFEVARREGWKKFGGDTPLMGEHWHHESGPDYVGGDRIDFTRPSNLMYTDIGGRRVLTAVAFIVRIGDGEPLPRGFAGSADRWHVHDMVRAITAATAERPLLRLVANWWLDANYRNRGDNRGRLAMVHAWVTLPNPDGIFADTNRTIPYLKLGLPAAWADGASADAARGLNLATPGGCKDVIDGGLWIADAGKATGRALHAACRAEAAAVTAALPAGPQRLNRAAETAWRRFDAEWNRQLTPVQQGRIAAISEHDSHAGHSGTAPMAHDGH